MFKLTHTKLMSYSYLFFIGLSYDNFCYDLSTENSLSKLNASINLRKEQRIEGLMCVNLQILI